MLTIAHRTNYNYVCLQTNLVLEQFSTERVLRCNERSRGYQFKSIIFFFKKSKALSINKGFNCNWFRGI